ncbi:MAG TPA: hypothetical protein DCS43_05745 [Verrucomicrobia bacterium]|nr:hypothetical protein [Verrucomicrobiota bacterium]
MGFRHSVGMTGTQNTMAQQVIEARRRKGVTQSELAHQIDCKQSAISMFERGHANALAQPKIEAALEFLGIPATAIIVPLPTGELEKGSPTRRYCPVFDCPSNIPFSVQGALLVQPNPLAQPTHAGRYCAHCGELLESQCPECAAPLNPGACCVCCGTAYVNIPPNIDKTWIDTQHLRLRAIGLLAG